MISPLPASLNATLLAALITLMPSALFDATPTKDIPRITFDVVAALINTRYIPSAVSCRYPLLFAATLVVSELTNPFVFVTRVSILPFCVLRLVFVVLIFVSNSLIAARAFFAVVLSVAVPTLFDTVVSVLDRLLIEFCS